MTASSWHRIPQRWMGRAGYSSPTPATTAYRSSRPMASSATNLGSVGSQDGQFNTPCDIAVDGQGRVLVVDMCNHRVQVFTVEGNFLAKWGTEGGKVFVRRRFHLRPPCAGIYIRWYFPGQVGTRGNGDGQLEHPNGIAVDAQGRVVVADMGNHRVQVFSADGNFLAKWGSSGTSDGQFKSPRHVAVDSKGRILVAESGGKRVQVFGCSCFVRGFGCLAKRGLTPDNVLVQKRNKCLQLKPLHNWKRAPPSAARPAAVRNL